MGLNELTGVPWHVETLRRSEDDQKRHRSRCKYYKKGRCLKYNFRCFGSAHCDVYEEKNNKTVVVSNVKTNNNNTTKKKQPTGYFKVMFLDDNKIITRIIGRKSEGDYIIYNSPLVKEVIKNEVGSVFKINEVKVKIIEKNIK